MIRVEARTFPVSSPNFAAILRSWVMVARQRRALARLDADALGDIGLSRTDAENEAQRPFWDAPDNWRI